MTNIVNLSIHVHVRLYMYVHVYMHVQVVPGSFICYISVWLGSFT